MKYPAYIPFKTTKEQGEFLDTVENRSAYIREAIEEKRSIDTYLSDRTTTASDAKEAFNKIFERLDGKRQVQ